MSDEQVADWWGTAVSRIEPNRIELRGRPVQDLIGGEGDLGVLVEDEDQSGHAPLGRRLELQLRVRDRCTGNDGSVAKADYRDVDLAFAHPADANS